MARLQPDGALKLPANADALRPNLKAEIGYGLRVFGVQGVSTPYGGVSLAEDGAHTWHAGVRLALGPAFDAGLEAILGENVNDNTPDHGLALHARLRF